MLSFIHATPPFPPAPFCLPAFVRLARSSVVRRVPRSLPPVTAYGGPGPGHGVKVGQRRGGAGGRGRP